MNTTFKFTTLAIALSLGIAASSQAQLLGGGGSLGGNLGGSLGGSLGGNLGGAVGGAVGGMGNAGGQTGALGSVAGRGSLTGDIRASRPATAPEPRRQLDAGGALNVTKSVEIDRGASTSASGSLSGSVETGLVARGRQAAGSTVQGVRETGRGVVEGARAIRFDKSVSVSGSASGSAAAAAGGE